MTVVVIKHYSMHVVLIMKNSFSWCYCSTLFFYEHPHWMQRLSMFTERKNRLSKFYWCCWCTVNALMDGTRVTSSQTYFFALNGLMPFCALYEPGCICCSTVSDHGTIYIHLCQMYQLYCVKTVVDSAFKLKGSNFLIKSSQSPSTDQVETLYNKQAMPVWQLSEWGMR